MRQETIQWIEEYSHDFAPKVEGKGPVKAGFVFGFLTHPDGSIEHMPAIDLGPENFIARDFHRKNIIVNTASLLAAQLFKGEDVPGIRTLALGEGATGIDLFNPPPPQPTQEQLEAEIIRKVFIRADFIKTDGTGDVSSAVTNIVDFEYEFLESEAVGSLTEMGNFGGIGSEQTNSGIMVNYITFPLWSKPLGARLGIIWRFLF